MSNQVKVEDLEVFSLFRAAMLRFAQAAEQSISNADSQIARTHSWLEGEQLSHWQGQLRKRTEAVSKAQEAVRQKKLYKDFSGHTRNAAQEEKVLAQCIGAVEEARNKIEAVRKWLPKLEKAADMYRSGVSRLGKILIDDIPRAVALLDRLAASLEQYVQIASPAGNTTESVVPGSFDPSIARGETEGTNKESTAHANEVVPAAADGQTAPAEDQAEAPDPEEDRDVGNGQ